MRYCPSNLSDMQMQCNAMILLDSVSMGVTFVLMLLKMYKYNSRYKALISITLTIKQSINTNDSEK